MMREFMRKARPLAAVLVVSGFLAACGDDDDPAGPAFTAEVAEQTADAADEVTAPLEASVELNANVWNAFGTLVGFGGGAVSPMMPFEAARSLEGMKLRGLPSLPSLPSLSASAPQGILIPDAVLGLTFEWNVDSARYVASDQAGAPANGVRFVYYAVDPSGFPVEPLNALGYLQLVDASTSAVSRLEVGAVRTAGSVQLADYFVQGSLTGNLQTMTLTIASAGFVSDGNEQIDFDINYSETASSTGTATLAMDVTLTGADASLSFDYLTTGTDARFDEEGTFIVEHGDNEAVFDWTGIFLPATVTYTVDGGLSFNGNEVVIFDGDGFAPTFTRPDGSDLTATEIAALGRMWGAFISMQIFVIQMVSPFFFLLLFSGA